MRIAVFSDVHGNLVALRTLLEHLQFERFDAIYCLGDLFTPYPGAREAWELVQAAGVQCVLGNNEAALLTQCEGRQDYATDPVRFRPFLKNVEEIAPFLKEIQAIPLNRSINFMDTIQIHLCHFSPGEVLRGLNSEFQLNLEAYAGQVAEPVILTGHLHVFAARDIRGKQVYTVGSAGLPLKGSHQLEYAVIEDNQGAFAISYQLLPYPVDQEINLLLQQRFLQDYGPVAWLAFDEIVTQRDRIVSFFKDYLPLHGTQQRDYYDLVESFLREIGRWETVAGYIERSGK